MTSKKNTRKGLARMTWALVVALVWAVCLSCVAMAAESKTEKQTLDIAQVIVKQNDDGTILYDTPIRSNYKYTLKPLTAGAPMPDEESEKSGVYKFQLKGTADKEVVLTFTLDRPQKYLYEVSRVEATPSGDKVTPETHIFGYLIEQNKDGSYSVIPFTCYDNTMEYVVDPKTGEPTGIILINYVYGKAVAKGDPGKDGKDGQDGKDGKDGSDGKDGQNCTCKDGKNGCSCDTKSGSCNCSGTCNCSKCSDDKTTTTTKSGSGTTNNNSSNNSGSNSSSNNSSSNRSSGTSGTTSSNVVTRTVNKIVNTGDPYQVGLWLGLIVASGAALIILLVVRRKQDDEEETL